MNHFQHISTPRFTAHASFGLRRAYSNEAISHEEFIDRLQYSQRIVKAEFGINLSAAVSQTEIVLHKHHEPHLRLDFINYPEFPSDKSKLKSAIIYLVEFLAQQLSQNRVVLTFPTEHLMIRHKNQLDPGVIEPKETPQELQAQALFEKYKGQPLLSSWLQPNEFLSLRFPEGIMLVSDQDYQNPQKGIPLFLRAIQAGQARPVIPALELFYDKPTRIAIYTQFLFSGTPINLEIWEVQGAVDLNAEEPGRLLKKIKAND